MGLFSKTEHSAVSKIHHAISYAFEKVKRDTHLIFEWINFFHKKHESHDERLDHMENHHQYHADRINKIEQQLAYMPKTNEEIKQIIDNYYSYEPLQRKIDEINARMDRIENNKVERRVNLKERLVKKITKNSKDYIKSVIKSLISKYSRISAPQIKEIVVEEQGLCSKSSFYRILTELEQEPDISSIQDGKEKIFMSKTELTH